MHIRIVRCPDEGFKPYVMRAVEFFGESLIPNKNMSKNLNIKVKFSNKIKDFGYAEIDGYNSHNKPRDFILTVHSNIGARSIIETLAHEMVHIKQFVYCETNESLSKWLDFKIDSDKIDYWDLPWEIEAYGREAGLLTKFVVKEKLWEVFDGFKNPDDPIEYTKIKWKKVEKSA
jgi:hypothetical protein